MLESKGAQKTIAWLNNLFFLSVFVPVLMIFYLLIFYSVALTSWGAFAVSLSLITVPLMIMLAKQLSNGRLPFFEALFFALVCIPMASGLFLGMNYNILFLKEVLFFHFLALFVTLSCGGSILLTDFITEKYQDSVKRRRVYLRVVSSVCISFAFGAGAIALQFPQFTAMPTFALVFAGLAFLFITTERVIETTRAYSNDTSLHSSQEVKPEKQTVSNINIPEVPIGAVEYKESDEFEHKENDVQQQRQRKLSDNNPWPTPGDTKGRVDDEGTPDVDTISKA